MHTIRLWKGRRDVARPYDEGFTLIELLVVLLIIGVLLTIAIPTFLSTTASANNTAAQANLKTALTGADTYFTTFGSQSYVDLDYSAGGTSTISSIGTGIVYLSGAANSSTGPHFVSVYVLDSGDAVVLTALARGSLDCWGILDIKTPLPTSWNNETAVGTYYFVATGSSVSTCVASSVSPTTISSTGFPHG